MNAGGIMGADFTSKGESKGGKEGKARHCMAHIVGA
jgi:hypothetical protein